MNTQMEEMSKEEFVSSEYVGSTILLHKVFQDMGLGQFAREFQDALREAAKKVSLKEFRAIKEDYYDYMMTQLGS